MTTTTKTSRKYKLLIFDMDGTILDTLEDLQDSVNVALEMSGYPRRTREEVRNFVGNGIRKLVERAVPEGTSEDSIEQVYLHFNQYYKIHCKDKTRSYSGITELLKELGKRGYLLAVVSNKADYAVQELCKQYFHGLFHVSVGESAGILPKPSPDMVNKVLEQLDTHRNEAVYIGDSEVDVETAVNAGMNSIIVEWGFRTKDFLIQQGAREFAAHPEEILQKV